MHHCQENIPLYKHMVSGERLGENVHHFEKESIEEVLWEPRRRMQGLRIEERKCGEYE